jgi:hypothetical protein
VQNRLKKQRKLTELKKKKKTCEMLEPARWGRGGLR